MALETVIVVIDFLIFFHLLIDPHSEFCNTRKDAVKMECVARSWAPTDRPMEHPSTTPFLTYVRTTTVTMAAAFYGTFLTPTDHVVGYLY